MKTFDLVSLEKQLKPLGFVLCFSIIGFILNLFPVSLFANLYLILGNVAFIFVAMRFGPLYSFFSAVIVSSALIYAFGHPFSVITFSLEAIFISIMRRRGWYILYADIFYWLLFGMPITALILAVFTDLSHEFWAMTIIKQAFNALICCNIAGLILYFFPKLFAISYREQPIIQRSFRAQIVYATTQVIIFTIVMLSLFISQNVIGTLHDNTENNLHDKKELLVKQGNIFVDKHMRALQTSAHAISLLSDLDERSLKDIIDFDVANYPNFVVVYISDVNGNIIASTGQDNVSQQSRQYINSTISQQNYFKNSMAFEGSHLSNVIFGNLDNVTSDEGMIIYSQSFDYHGDGAIRGGIHAKMDLNALETLIPKTVLDNMQYVISDDYDKVIYASESLNLERYSHFKFTNKNNLSFKQTQLINIEDKSSKGEINKAKDYLASEGDFDRGWKLRILLSSYSVIETVEKEYFFIFALLFLSFIISMSLAQKISHQLTKPLSFIIKQLRFQNSSSLENPLPATAAKEIATLYKELLENKNQIMTYQSELEEKVELRTLELQNANNKLTQLAQKDGLTNVFNRRYFDDNFSFFQKLSFRNNSSLALLLLDLDHFKRVNDLHGHLSGDECLRVISQVLKEEFCRETDLIARYGGEEFVIVVSGIDYPKLLHKLEKLRKRIEQTVIYGEDNNKIHVTASIGAVIAEATFALDSSDWIKVADLCLYKAKKSGRNMVLIENFSEPKVNS